jgi:hypothetical protein
MASIAPNRSLLNYSFQGYKVASAPHSPHSLSRFPLDSALCPLKPPPCEGFNPKLLRARFEFNHLASLPAGLDGVAYVNTAHQVVVATCTVSIRW